MPKGCPDPHGQSEAGASFSISGGDANMIRGLLDDLFFDMTLGLVPRSASGDRSSRRLRDLDELSPLQGFDRRHLLGRLADDLERKLARPVGYMVGELDGSDRDGA